MSIYHYQYKGQERLTIDFTTLPCTARIALQKVRDDLVSRAIPECKAEAFLINNQSFCAECTTFTTGGEEDNCRLWVDILRAIFKSKYINWISQSPLLPNATYKVFLDKKTKEEFFLTLDFQHINNALSRKKEFSNIKQRTLDTPHKDLKFFLQTLELIAAFRKSLESVAPCYMDLFYMKKSEEEKLRAGFQERVTKFLSQIETTEYDQRNTADIEFLSELQNSAHLTPELQAKARSLALAPREQPRLLRKDAYQSIDIPEDEDQKSELPLVKPLAATVPITRNYVRAEIIHSATRFSPYGPVELNLLPLFISHITGFDTWARDTKAFLDHEFERFISYLTTLNEREPLSYQRLQGFANSHGNSQYEINETKIAKMCLTIANSKPNQGKFETAKQELFTLLGKEECTTSLYYELPQRGDGNCGYYTVACRFILSVIQEKIALDPQMFSKLFASMREALQICREKDSSYFDSEFLASVDTFLRSPQRFDSFQLFLKRTCTTLKGLWEATMFLGPAIRLFTCDNSPEAERIYENKRTRKPPENPRIDHTWTGDGELHEAAKLLNSGFTYVSRASATSEYKCYRMHYDGDSLCIASLNDAQNHWCLLIPAAEYENLTTLIRDFGPNYQPEATLEPCSMLTTLPQPGSSSTYSQSDLPPSLPAYSVNADEQPLLSKSGKDHGRRNYGYGSRGKESLLWDEERPQYQPQNTNAPDKINTIKSILTDANNPKWNTHHTISGTLFNLFCGCINSPPTAIAQLRALYDALEQGNGTLNVNENNVADLISKTRKIVQEANGRQSFFRRPDTQYFYDEINTKLDAVDPQNSVSYQH